jgi:hypothetical protein
MFQQLPGKKGNFCVEFCDKYLLHTDFRVYLNDVRIRRKAIQMQVVNHLHNSPYNGFMHIDLPCTLCNLEGKNKQKFDIIRTNGKKDLQATYIDILYMYLAIYSFCTQNSQT